MNGYSKAMYFGLGYSALGSLAFLFMRLGINLDFAAYPYQKPLMLVVAALAVVACVVLLIFDIRRESACRLRDRVIVTLAVIIATFDSLMKIWGVLILYIGGL